MVPYLIGGVLGLVLGGIGGFMLACRLGSFLMSIDPADPWRRW